MQHCNDLSKIVVTKIAKYELVFFSNNIQVNGSLYV